MHLRLKINVIRERAGWREQEMVALKENGYFLNIPRLKSRMESNQTLKEEEALEVKAEDNQLLALGDHSGARSIVKPTKLDTAPKTQRRE